MLRHYGYNFNHEDLQRWDVFVLRIKKGAKEAPFFVNLYSMVTIDWVGMV
jgi:hypothetical protein